MISFTNASDNNNERFRTPSEKRTKKEKREKKSKRQRLTKEAIENFDNNNVPMVEEVTEFTPEVGESPIFIPTLSSPEPDTPESFSDMPIQSHANVDLLTNKMYRFTSLRYPSLTVDT